MAQNVSNPVMGPTIHAFEQFPCSHKHFRMDETSPGVSYGSHYITYKSYPGSICTLYSSPDSPASRDSCPGILTLVQHRSNVYGS